MKKFENEELITAYKFSQIMNVTRKAVADAIKSGRISVTIIDGQKRINPKEAMLEWKENTNESMQRSKSQTTPRRPKNNEDSHKTVDQMNYAKARTIKERYAAKLAKLDFEERSKTLINSEELKEKAFEISCIIRDRLLDLPLKLSATLAAETDSHKINETLKKEFTNVLEQLVFEFEGNK